MADPGWESMKKQQANLSKLLRQIEKAEADREDRGKSTVLPEHWEEIWNAYKNFMKD